VGAKYLIAAGFMVLVLAGCVHPTCECGAAPSSPLPAVPVSPASGFDVLITDKDQDVTVHAGQKIEVYLRQRSGLTPWTGLRTDAETVLTPIPTGITAARGVTIGGFQAVAPGVANITATATADCSPGQPCPMFAALFSVRVTVL
jgi:hypothetical protein